MATPELQQKLRAQLVRIGDRLSPGHPGKLGYGTVDADSEAERPKLLVTAPVPDFPVEVLGSDSCRVLQEDAAMCSESSDKGTSESQDVNSSERSKGTSESQDVNSSEPSKWLMDMGKEIAFSPRIEGTKSKEMCCKDEDPECKENHSPNFSTYSPNFLSSKSPDYISSDATFDPSEYIALGVIGHQPKSKDVEALVETLQQRERETQRLKERVAELEGIVACCSTVNDKNNLKESSEPSLVRKHTDMFAPDGGTGATPNKILVPDADGKGSSWRLWKSRLLSTTSTCFGLIIFASFTISIAFRSFSMFPHPAVVHQSNVFPPPAAVHQSRMFPHPTAVHQSRNSSSSSSSSSMSFCSTAVHQSSSNAVHQSSNSSSSMSSFSTTTSDLASGAQLHNDMTPISSMWRFQLYQTPDSKFVDRSFHQQLGAEWRFLEEQHICDGRTKDHVQILQLDDDLNHFQALLERLKPQMVIEIGTYRGGLTYFLASVLQQLGLSHSRVLTVDIIDMDSNFHNLDNHLICPVCLDCDKVYETDVWQNHVLFFQGNSVKISQQIKLEIDRLHAEFGHLGPTMFVVDAQRTYDEMLLHFHLYGGSVSMNSYFVVQGVLPYADRYQAGAYEATLQVLSVEPFQWEWEQPPQVHGESRHMWLRRTSQGAPIELSYIDEMVEQEVFSVLAEGGRCVDTELAQGVAPSILACEAACLRYGSCNFTAFVPHKNLGEGQCFLYSRCSSTEAAEVGTVVSKRVY